MDQDNGNGIKCSDRNVASEDRVLLASALVTDARDGLHSDYKTDPKSLKLYLVYRHWALNYTLYALIIVNHSLAFYEPLGGKKATSQWDSLTVTIELFCLLYYLTRLALLASFLPAHRFWHDAKNVLLVVTIVLTLLDLVLYFSLPPHLAIRWTPALRPLFIVNFAENRQIRRAIRNIRNTLPEIINVLILFFLSVATFSIIGLKLFDKKGIRIIEKQPLFTRNGSYFTNFEEVFFSLYVLVTTSNNPDVMMPAYNSNRWYALFFIIFLVINLYLFMNIILAVVYNNYRKHLKNEVKHLLLMKRQSLSRAFDIMSENVKPLSGGAAQVTGLTLATFRELMQIIETPSVTPRKSLLEQSSVTEVFWAILEVEEQIPRESFLKLAELLNMNVKVIPTTAKKITLIESCLPTVYNHRFSRLFRGAVKSRYFRFAFDGLILVNAILIALELKILEWFLLLAFTIEIIAKLYTFGFLSFIKKMWNVFDALVIGSAAIFWILISINMYPEKDFEQYLDLLLILRILRLFKIIETIERFHVVVKTVQSLLPSIMTYGGLLFVVFYFYAIIGMQVFGGHMQGNVNGCKNDTVHCCPGSKLYSGMQYCTINFNTLETSMIFLFDLMVVNQWHVLAKGVEVMMNSKWTRLYFVSFHLICVIVVLNIFTAFVLEAFILEYTNVTQGSSYENELQRKIQQLGISSIGRTRGDSAQEEELDLVDADHNVLEANVGPVEGETRNRAMSVISLGAGCPYKVAFTEKKSVEVVLMRMFENEIDLEG